MIKDLYLLITAVVQEKGADYKFKKPSVDDGTPKELELKIQKIDVFNDVKDKLVETLTLSIPIQQIDESLADELTDMVLKNKGNVNLYINLIDESSPNKIKLFSRQNRLTITKDIYKRLKKAKSNGLLDYKVN